jgi:hypothetical protein
LQISKGLALNNQKKRAERREPPVSGPGDGPRKTGGLRRSARRLDRFMPTHIDKSSTWDVWAWRIWWLVYVLATVGLIVWYRRTDNVLALLGLACAVGVGLLNYMFWSQWYPERTRQAKLSRYCEAQGLSYWISKSAQELIDRHDDALPVFAKGDWHSKIRNVVVGDQDGLPFEVFDCAYVSQTFGTNKGSIDTGRRQTVLICEADGLPNFVLEPRTGVTGAIASLVVGDSLDLGKIGLSDMSRQIPELSKTHRIWGSDPEAIQEAIRSSPTLKSKDRPWTVECVDGVLAIYRPSDIWSTKKHEQTLAEVRRILAELVP